MDFIEQIDSLLEKEYTARQELDKELIELDAEKHEKAVDKFEDFRIKNQEEINDIVEKQRQSEEPKIDIEESELLTKFRALVKEGLTPNQIAKEFLEVELISICEELGHKADKNTKEITKVKSIIKAIS